MIEIENQSREFKNVDLFVLVDSTIVADSMFETNNNSPSLNIFQTTLSPGIHTIVAGSRDHGIQKQKSFILKKEAFIQIAFVFQRKSRGLLEWEKKQGFRHEETSDSVLTPKDVHIVIYNSIPKKFY